MIKFSANFSLKALYRHSIRLVPACILFIFLSYIFGLSVVSDSFAQTKSAIARYGKYPITAAGLLRLKQDLKKDSNALRSNKKLCKNRKFARKFQMCDSDGDKLVNMRETMLATRKLSIDTDNDRLGDRYELLISHTNPLVADTDGDGVSDGDEVLLDHTNPGIPDKKKNCADPLFDGSGNTTGFNIPAPNIGNITRGQDIFLQKCSICHSNLNIGSTLDFPALKAKLSAAPMSLPSAYVDAGKLADIVAFLRRNDTAPDCPTTPVATPTIPSDAPPAPGVKPTPGCNNQYFDVSGNTTSFSIPRPMIGNIDRGRLFFESNCKSCHAERGQGFNYDQMQNAVTGPLMNITYVENPIFADLAANANRDLANVGCNGNPTPTAIPTAPPTSNPTPIPVGCANQYFDANGNTMPNQFAIPASLVGNIGQGQSLFGLACSSCHGERGTNFTYTQIQAAVTGPLMNINSVSTQQYAHLTAFLNRSSAAQNCGSPQPTPSPLDDVSAGRLVYQFTCQTCHRRPSEFRSLTSGTLKKAISEKSQMRSIVLTDEQIRVLLVYFRTQ